MTAPTLKPFFSIAAALVLLAGVATLSLKLADRIDVHTKEVQYLNSIEGMVDVTFASDGYVDSIIGASRVSSLGVKKSPANEFTDSHLSGISALSSLERLDLSHSAITDKGISEVLELSKLEVLTLVGVDVGHDSVRLLCCIDALQRIDLSGTRLQWPEVNDLIREFPHLGIIFMSNSEEDRED